MVTCLGNPAVEKSTPAMEGNGKQKTPNQVCVMSLLMIRGRGVDHCTCVQHMCESNYIMHYIIDETYGMIASINMPQHALTGMSNTLQSLSLPCALKRSGPPVGRKQLQRLQQAFLTTQLESGNWRKRTTTWHLNSQPTL